MISVCCTGTLSVPREEFQAWLVRLGYEFHIAPKVGTDILVVPDDSWRSNKVAKARRLGINIMTEREFRNLAMPEEVEARRREKLKQPPMSKDKLVQGLFGCPRCGKPMSQMPALDLNDRYYCVQCGKIWGRSRAEEIENKPFRVFKDVRAVVKVGGEIIGTFNKVEVSDLSELVEPDDPPKPPAVPKTVIPQLGRRKITL